MDISTKKTHKSNSGTTCRTNDKGERRFKTDIRIGLELKLPIAARQRTISHRFIHIVK